MYFSGCRAGCLASEMMIAALKGSTSKKQIYQTNPPAAVARRDPSRCNMNDSGQRTSATCTALCDEPVRTGNFRPARLCGFLNHVALAPSSHSRTINRCTELRDTMLIATRMAQPILNQTGARDTQVDKLGTPPPQVLIHHNFLENLSVIDKPSVYLLQDSTADSRGIHSRVRVSA